MSNCWHEVLPHRSHMQYEGKYRKKKSHRELYLYINMGTALLVTVWNRCIAWNKLFRLGNWVIDRTAGNNSCRKYVGNVMFNYSCFTNDVAISTQTKWWLTKIESGWGSWVSDRMKNKPPSYPFKLWMLSAWTYIDIIMTLFREKKKCIW